MIIRGDSAGSVAYWSRHLVRDDTNKRAEVKEISGLLAEDLPTALKEMEAIAAQSRCEGNFMYQANINPLAHERLTEAQWTEAVDTLEKNLGLEGHQRVVVEHEKADGRIHRHVIWNRIDVETLKTADMWKSHEKEMATQRELEARFDLTPTPTPAADRKRAPELWEIRAAERSGIDPDALRAEINEIWKSTDSGKAFAAALDERGYVLAKGDRRDFCVIDKAGDAHSLARCIEGARAKDVRERMGDVDRDSLPSVEEARAEQRATDRPAAEPEGVKEAEPVYATMLDDLDRKTFLDEVKDKPGASFDAGMGDVDRDSLPSVKEARAEQRATDRPATEPEGAKEAAPVYATMLDDSDRKTFWDDVTDKRGTGFDAGIGKPVLEVLDAATGAAEKLVDFVTGLLGGGDSKPPPSRAQLSQMEEIREQRRALAAMENIRDSIERGDRLNPSDIQNLTPTHLENIRLRGDDYVRDMIERMEQTRARENDYGRERER